MNNNNKCPCPNVGCKSHGVCCECVAKHNAKDQLPHCLFPDNNGDKSLCNFYLKLKERFG